MLESIPEGIVGGAVAAVTAIAVAVAYFRARITTILRDENDALSKRNERLQTEIIDATKARDEALQEAHRLKNLPQLTQVLDLTMRLMETHDTKNAQRHEEVKQLLSTLTSAVTSLGQAAKNGHS